MRRPLLPALVLFLPLVACTPRATVPDPERDRVTRELSGRQRYLRVAAYAMPLWGDVGKLLLTDQPGNELDLVETGGGEPIPPPAPERIVPPGTPVRITRVEFPSGWLIAQRVVMTPRYHPWVYLQSGVDRRPLVLVLSQTAATFEDVRAEVDRLLTDDDPAPLLAALPPEQRDAVLRKAPVEGMSARALEMAWGLPEKKRIDRPSGTEEWSWPEGKRRAFLRDDRVERLESRKR
jgi:hypothetical protein